MRRFGLLFCLTLNLVILSSVSTLAFDPVFKPPVSYEVGMDPVSLVCDYFNADSDIDLAVCCSNGISILLGRGDGTFYSGYSPASSGFARSIISGDFDGDMDIDLAVITRYDVMIFKGSGVGTFYAGESYRIGDRLYALISGDFNNDWDIDLAVLDNRSNSVIILAGAHSSTFENAGSISTGPDPRGIASGDFNGDGNLDLTVANFDWDNVSIMLGNGDLTFSSDVYYRRSYNPGTMITDDFNGDTNIDLAVNNSISQSVAILFGNGDGTLAPAEYYGIHPGSMTSNDFTGDGYPDLAIGHYVRGEVYILENKCDGTFSPAATYDIGAAIKDITFGDFDDDGDIDIATANTSTNDVSILINLAQSISIVCPRDTVLNSEVEEEVYNLDGFTIHNRGYSSRRYDYSVSSVGPATLDDAGNPASLSGTTPVLEQGESYMPPGACLIIPSIREPGIQEVSYTVSPSEYPDSSGTNSTIITYEPPVSVAFQSFEAVSRAGGIRLKWVVSNPDNIIEYNIYRSDDEGANFEIIGSGYRAGENSLEYLDPDAEPGIDYVYRIGAVEAGGEEIFSLFQYARLIPLKAHLKQNWPNPFNPSTRIEFTLPSAQNLRLNIYDVNGKLIRRLVDTKVSRGVNIVEWDGKNDKGKSVNSGVYYYRILSGKFSETKKMILLR